MTDRERNGEPGVDLQAGFLLAGRWHVQPAVNRLVGPGGEVRVPDKFMQVLGYLATHPGGVTRRQLMDAVWPGTVVVDEALTRAVSELRKLLDDDPREPRYIETIPKKGYRLLASVAAPGPDAPAPLPDGSRASGRSTPPWFRLLVASVAVMVGLVLAVRLAGRARHEAAGPTQTLALTSLPGVEEYPTLSPAGDRLAFAWEGDRREPTGVFVTVIGQPGQLRLAGGDDPDAHFAYPAWSPDAQTVAYCRVRGRARGIFAVPATGGAEEQLVGELFGQAPLMPDYSPDGAFLVFAAPTASGGPWGLHRLSLATGVREVRTRPSTPGGYDLRPRHAPDGQRLACLRATASGPASARLPLDGGEPTLLAVGERELYDLDWTRGGAALVVTADDGLWEFAARGGRPRLLSAGQALSCVSAARGQRLVAFTEARGDWDLWEVPAAGAGEPRRLDASSRPDWRPAQSHDGTRIAFVSQRAGHTQLWLADADGGQAHPLEAVIGADPDAPAWSPDDARLAYTARLAGRQAVCVLDLASGAVRVATPPDDDEARPAWSPDGRWLYVCRRQAGGPQIWRRPAAGGDPQPVTRGGGYKALASRDGATVYFMRARADTTGLWRVPAQGGAEEPACRLAGEVLIDFGVGPDGLVLCTATRVDAPEFRLWRWRPATGERATVARLTSRRAPGLDVHPQSGRILCDRIEHLESDLVGIRDY